MQDILNNTSFGLIRTNPLLTTNIKIVTDGKDVYLDSIDAHPLLSNIKYKKRNVTNGLYSMDLHKFYQQNNRILPKDISYKVYESDKSIYNKNLNNQFDFTYFTGTYYKDSNLYKQSLATFAPLWLNPKNIPDYYIIFKLKGGTSLDYNILNKDKNLHIDYDLLKQSIGNEMFFKNFIQNAEIIKSFDLTNNSSIGKYIRKHATENLNTNSLYISFDNNVYSNINGISYDDGGFISKDFDILPVMKNDNTMISDDLYITSLFKEHGVVNGNILNLEFLFDDNTESELYEFNRYFGLYVSEYELGKFKINNKKLYDYSLESKNQITDNGYITNNNGVILNLDLTKDSSLVQFDKEAVRIPYIKDVNDNFYSVNQLVDWSTGDVVTNDKIRLKNKSIKLSNFIDNNNVIDKVNIKWNDKLSPASFSFDIINNITTTDSIKIKIGKFKNDELLITFNNNDIDNKSNSELAKFISDFINNHSLINTEFDTIKSISIKNKVIIFSRINGTNDNNFTYELFTQNLNKNPFDNLNKNSKFVEIINYTTSNNNGFLYRNNFTGGSNHNRQKFFINKSDLNKFINNEYNLLLNNKKGKLSNCKISNYGPYLEEFEKNTNGDIINFKNINKYYTCTLDDNYINESGELILYNYKNNTNGFLSIYPIKDFDFDFYSEEYSRDIDSDELKISNFYESPGNLFIGNDLTELNIRDYYKIKDELGLNLRENSIIYKKGLISNININKTEPIKSEYDRLLENKNLILSDYSRTPAFINKWVYENNGKDVRENNYRLNSFLAFDKLNFTPSYESGSANEIQHTHEWYYLQKYPPYYKEFNDKKNTYSYFGYEIESEKLKDITEDYFLSYFTREFIDDVYITRDFKYSTFKYNGPINKAETLFRGVKVIINDNIDNKKSLFNPHEYDNYKFSVILTYDDNIEYVNNYKPKIEIIENKKYKNITIVIKGKFDNIFFRDIDGNRFIDRFILYKMKNVYEYDYIYDNQGNITNIKKGKLLMNISNDLSFKNIADRINRNDKIIYTTIDVNGELIKSNFKIGILKPDSFIKNIDLSVEKDETIGILSHDKYKIFKNTSNKNIVNFNRISGYYTPKVIDIIKFVDYNSDNLYIDNKSDIFGDYKTDKDVEIIKNGRNEIFRINKNTTTSFKLQVDYTQANNYYYGEMTVVTNNDSVFFNTHNIISNVENNIKLSAEIKGEYVVVYINTINMTRDGFNQNSGNIITGFVNFKILHVLYNNKNKTLDNDPLYRNTRIDTSDKNIGIIKNFGYTKINTQDLDFIGSYDYDINTNINNLTDKKDYSIFSSCFDPLYYNLYLDEFRSAPISGFLNTKEQKCLFGSKILNIPNQIVFDKFNKYININNDNIINYNINDTSIEINLNIEYIIYDYFMDSKFKNTIQKYKLENSNISTENFILGYIRDNIINKYTIKNIFLWERVNKDLDKYNIEFNLNDNEKIKNNFIKTPNFTVNKNNLNVNIIYNKYDYNNKDIAVTIVLEKNKN